MCNKQLMQREKGWCSGTPTLYTNVAQVQLLAVGFTQGSLSSKQTLLNSSTIWENAGNFIQPSSCPFAHSPVHPPTCLCNSLAEQCRFLGIVRAWLNSIVHPVPCQKLWKITYHWSNQATNFLLMIKNKCTVVPLLNNTNCHAITFTPRTRSSFFFHIPGLNQQEVCSVLPEHQGPMLIEENNLSLGHH